MPEIISAHHHRGNVFKSLWQQYRRLDRVLKIAFVTYILIVISTPFIVLNYQIYKSKAQEQNRFLTPIRTETSLQLLSTKIREINSRIEETQDPIEKDKYLVEIKKVARERESKMIELMEDNPQMANKLAITQEERIKLPIEIQGSIERSIEVDGTLDIIHEDYIDIKKSTYRYFLNLSNNKRYNLYFEQKLPLVSNTKIKTKGIVLKENIAALGVEERGIIALSQTVEQPVNFQKKAAVILVNFQNDIRIPWEKSYVSYSIFTKTNDYYQENSYGKYSITGDIFGYYTLPIDKTCDFYSIRYYAIEASDADIYFPNYNEVIIAGQFSCGWAGMANVGYITDYLTDDGPITTGFSIDADMSTRVIAHELGHTSGVWHANLLDCQGTDENCYSIEYGDILDVMGWGNATHMNGYHKEKIGFFNPRNVVEVNQSGDYIISVLERFSLEPQVLKMPTIDGDFVYIEYRQPVGADYQFSSNTLDGAIIYTAPSQNSGGDTQLMIASP